MNTIIGRKFLDSLGGMFRVIQIDPRDARLVLCETIGSVSQTYRVELFDVAKVLTFPTL